MHTPRFCVSLMSGRTDGTALPAPAKMQPPRGCRSATPSNANEHHARAGLKKRSQQEAGWRLQLTLGHIDKCYFCETESSRWCNQGLGRGRLVSECGCKISCCWRCTFNAGMRASILGDALKCPNNCCAVVTEIQELDFAPMADLPQGWRVVVKGKKPNRYKRYVGPAGREAQSAAQAWRLHEDAAGGVQDGEQAAAVAEAVSAAAAAAPKIKQREALPLTFENRLGRNNAALNLAEENGWRADWVAIEKRERKRVPADERLPRPSIAEREEAERERVLDWLTQLGVVSALETTKKCWLLAILVAYGDPSLVPPALLERPVPTGPGPWPPALTKKTLGDRGVSDVCDAFIEPEEDDTADGEGGEVAARRPTRVRATAPDRSQPEAWAATSKRVARRVEGRTSGLSVFGFAPITKACAYVNESDQDRSWAHEAASYVRCRLVDEGAADVALWGDKIARRCVESTAAAKHARPALMPRRGWLSDALGCST